MWFPPYQYIYILPFILNPTMDKVKVSLTIDKDIYDRLMKVVEQDDTSKLSNIINGALRRSLPQIEELHKKIGDLKAEMEHGHKRKTRARSEE